MCPPRVGASPPQAVTLKGRVAPCSGGARGGVSPPQLGRSSPRDGQAVIIADAATDEAWRDRASITELKLRSVLAVPLRLAGKATHVLYLEDRAEAGRF